jgi:pimeloyl-ACP methyl ester carboxylesterase
MPQKITIAGGLVIAAIGAIGAIITALYRRDIRAARKRVLTGSKIADRKFGAIEYAEQGEGTPLLVIHGAGGGFDQGLELGEDLAREGFRVIAMSRFGYLRTPLPDNPSSAAQADAHVALMDALGIEKAAVMGVSAGAPSATQLAIRHPDRVSALVLMVPGIYAPHPENKPSITPPAASQFLFSTALNFDFPFWAMRRASKRTFVRAILGTPPQDLDKVSPAERARVERLLDHILPVSLRRLGMINDGKIVSTLPRYDLEKISAPTLCISVADDLYGTFVPARYTAGQVQNGRFIGYATGGHILASHQEDVTRAITSFLGSVKAPPPPPALRPEIASAVRSEPVNA